MFTKLLTVKAAAAVLGVLVGGGVAAAATGNLPAPAQQAAHALLGGAGVPAPAGATGTTRAHPVGPDAAGRAALGLCRAWSAGQGGQHGSRLDAPAFAALAKAAGGSDQIAAYCARVTASTAGGSGQGQGGPPSSVPRQGQGGPPSSLPGQGQAGPPSSVPPSSLPGQGQAGPPSSLPDQGQAAPPSTRP